MRMRTRTAIAWLPLAAGAVLALALELDGTSAGLLLGAGAFVGLRLAQRPLPLLLAAWTLAAAAALGFSAALLAGLVGLSVRAMMDAGAQHWVGNTLAVLAVALGTLGVLIAAAAMLARRRDERDE